MPSNPVIVVPGITASQLRDEYPVEPEVVWSAVFNRDYDRIALHPDDVRYERDEPARVATDQVFKLPYGELIAELRHDLSPHADEPVPVYPFAYDWRRALDHTENRLTTFFEEVIERTALLPHYFKAGWHKRPRVDLVGHSMGGLVIAGWLQSRKSAPLIGKIATLGSPYRGSLEVPLKITTGLADLGTGASASREREVARLTPALYHLIPSFSGAVTADPGLSDSLFDPAAWQPKIIDTLAEYLRLHGRDASLKTQQRKTQARELFASLLKQAAAHRKRLESFNPSQTGLTPDDWLCIVGVGSETRTQMHIKKVGGQPEFVITSEDRLDQYKDPNPDKSVKTGDGTVPYLGAACAFIPKEKIVCVTPAEFGYWELKDRLLEGPVGLHGMLPAMNLIHRLIVSHFLGKRRPGTLGRRAPDLPDSAAWKPPIKGLIERKKTD